MEFWAPLIVGLAVGGLGWLFMPSGAAGIVATCFGVMGAGSAAILGLAVGLFPAPDTPLGIFVSAVGAFALIGVYRAVLELRRP